MLLAILNRAHHFAYAAALVAAVFVWCFFHQAPRVVQVAAPTAVAAPGTAAREFDAAVAIAKALGAASGRASVIEQPAVNVIPHGGISDAAFAQVLAAIGKARTAPAYSVKLVAPTPGPAPTLPPDVSAQYAAWHHADTFNATAEAIAQSHVAVSVTQEPIPPSRMKALYLYDGSAGAAYALMRREQFDFDIAATAGKYHVQPGVGIEYRIKNTSAGVFLGATLRSGHVNPAAGFSVSF